MLGVYILAKRWTFNKSGKQGLRNMLICKD